MLQLNSKLAAFEVYLRAQCSAGSLICVCVCGYLALKTFVIIQRDGIKG